jgi:hypothetical protein
LRIKLDVIDRLPRFIDEFENATRLHSALGCQNPVPIEITNLRGAASSITGLALVQLQEGTPTIQWINFA